MQIKSLEFSNASGSCDHKQFINDSYLSICYNEICIIKMDDIQPTSTKRKLDQVENVDPNPLNKKIKIDDSDQKNVYIVAHYI